MTMVEMESEDGPETGTPPDDESPADFHLVALGASAGGLQSLCRFFDHVSAEPTAAYVVLMHLAPDRASNLVHILSDHAPLPVQEIEDGDPIATGHVYVPPPGMKLTVEGDRFRIAARERPTEHLIDALFTSVADAWKEKTIGIVLSGSGTDGTWGVSAIREEGGFTLAEDPRHAQFGEMPRSAVETTHVDVVDDPEALAREVTRYLSFDDGDVRPEPRNVDLRRILAVVKEQTGRDFQGYKVNTIRRRIGRRMRLRHCDEVSDYLDLIQEDDAELRRLVRDLLITVTQFFRDPDGLRHRSG